MFSEVMGSLASNEKNFVLLSDSLKKKENKEKEVPAGKSNILLFSQHSNDSGMEIEQTEATHSQNEMLEEENPEDSNGNTVNLNQYV